MKKIFTLFTLLLLVAVTAQAKTDKLYATFTNAATNASKSTTNADGTYTLNWEGSSSNSVRAFSGISSSIAKYKKLHINVASGSESTSYRVILYCNTRSSTAAYVGAYTGSTTITLADLTYTTGNYDNNGYDDINIICVAGSGNGGNVTFQKDGIYLETAEYDFLSITTPIADMSWYSYSDNSAYSTSNLTKNLDASLGQNKIIYGPTSAAANSAYMNVAGYDKVNFTLSDAGDAGIRLMYGNATGNDIITINTDASTTSYSASLSTMSKIGTIKTKNVSVSTENEITVSAIEFEKSMAATSTTAFNVTNAITGKVSYDRKFTAGQTYTICLPFSLTKAEMDGMGKFYYFNSVSSTGVLDFKQANNSVSAYTPYLFIPSTTGTPFANLTKDIEATKTTTVEKTNATAGTFTFTGLLAATSDIAAANSGKTVYGFSATDGDFKKAGTGVSVNAFRAVIVGPATGEARLDVVFNDDDATAIQDVRLTADEENGATYNLAGQRVGADHKGLVIKNGRKYMVK